MDDGLILEAGFTGRGKSCAVGRGVMALRIVPPLNFFSWIMEGGAIGTAGTLLIVEADDSGLTPGETIVLEVTIGSIVLVSLLTVMTRLLGAVGTGGFLVGLGADETNVMSTSVLDCA